MSGAGRGTPRVSPSQGAAPNPPVNPGGDSYGLIIEIPDAKFAFEVQGGGTQALPAAGAVLQYAFDAPTSSGELFVALPRGLVRGHIQFSYTQGAVGGSVGIRFRFGTAGNRRIFYPTQPVAGGDDFQTRGREQIFVFSGVTGAFLPFTIPPGANALGVWVNEIGQPGVPGSFSIENVYADNLAQISLLPNNTANL